MVHSSTTQLLFDLPRPLRQDIVVRHWTPPGASSAEPCDFLLMHPPECARSHELSSWKQLSSSNCATFQKPWTKRETQQASPAQVAGLISPILQQQCLLLSASPVLEWSWSPCFASLEEAAIWKKKNTHPGRTWEASLSWREVAHLWCCQRILQ